MRNKLSKLVVGLMILGVFSACSVEGNKNSSSSLISTNSSSSILPSNDSSSSNSGVISTPIIKEELSTAAQLFVSNVNAISLENISISDKEILDGARFIYSFLTETEKSFSKVQECKNKLDLAIEKFNEIYNQFLTQKELETRKDTIEDGKRILVAEVRRRNLDEKTYTDEKTYESVLSSLGANNYDDL